MGRKICEFVVWGKPHGKERCQFNSRTKKAYTPQTQNEAEGDVRRAYYQAGYERLEFDFLVRVDVICCYALPMDLSEAEKKALIGTPAYKGSPVERKRSKAEKMGPIPDGDNVLKTVQDALQGQPRKNAPLAIRDDSQIIEASVRSIYGRKSCTKIKITVLGDVERGEQ